MAKAAKPGRKKNGQFTKNSTAAKRAGKKGGLTTAKKNAKCHKPKKAVTKSRSKQRSLRFK